MRTRFTTLLLPLAVSLAMVVFAPAKSNPAGASEKGKSVKLTGCLESGSEPNTYMLKNVSMADSGSSGAPNEMARSESSFRLIAEGNVNLKDHVGHKVEVTGIESESSSESSMEGSESSASSPSSSSYGTSTTPELKVSSIRHISTTCP